MDTSLKFFHAPQSRSLSILWLLEELDVPYRTEIVDFRAKGGVPEAYRAIQPNKKVPAIEHDGVVVTERAAIAQYLAETFPAKKLGVPPGDRLRGPYLTWLVYVDAVLDPALAAKSLGWKYDAQGVSFGSFDDLLANVEKTLRAHPYAIGDTFTAVDTQLGMALYWGMDGGKMLPENPVFRAYVARLQDRPAFARAMKMTF